MKLEGIKVVYLVADGFEDLEFWVPIMRLREEGARVTIAGPKAGEAYQGKHGLNATADTGFDDAAPQWYDAVCIPGGWAPDKLRRYDSVKRLVKTLYDQQKPVGMICHAGLVGISAGIVKGHEATGSEGIKDDLINAGATWRDESAFRSGCIVWGRVVPDIPNYCRELVEALVEEKERLIKIR
ncbi:MAG: type 1 glutamine amidotransferase [Chloroflexi bacterium]|nr:MAG: type 1 glutamine amidotransferase [Chloroflexota bacterium]